MGYALGSPEVAGREAESADNPARLSPSDPARAHLKPLGFVDTTTLSEILADKRLMKN
ncbi:hypothetical protein MHH52_06955 [Paenibacillus sp. FSL K6-0276]|uniref:hypothetical protein n=1 Tax=Paenibacillus sp. FSL K6-0276 TaxID=2921450 RepID=UPI0030EF35C0